MHQIVVTEAFTAVCPVLVVFLRHHGSIQCQTKKFPFSDQIKDARCLLRNKFGHLSASCVDRKVPFVFQNAVVSASVTTVYDFDKKTAAKAQFKQQCSTYTDGCPVEKVSRAKNYPR